MTGVGIHLLWRNIMKSFWRLVISLGNLRPKCGTREANGRELSYIEGWYAISEANRIFGFDGWSRETLTPVVYSRGSFLAVYTARVQISVQAGGSIIIREGHGSGEGRAASILDKSSSSISRIEDDD